MHMQLIQNQHLIQTQVVSFYTKEHESIDLQAFELLSKIQKQIGQNDKVFKQIYELEAQV